jgi:hypothetical protein
MKKKQNQTNRHEEKNISKTSSFERIAFIASPPQPKYLKSPNQIDYKNTDLGM